MPARKKSMCDFFVCLIHITHKHGPNTGTIERRKSGVSLIGLKREGARERVTILLRVQLNVKDRERLGRVEKE